MVPPLEWKRFRSLGVYSSSLDMNFDSKWTIVIRWNSSYIWNTNNEISFKASNITSVHIVLTTFLKARSHLILVIIFIISPQEHRIEFGRIICYLVFDTLLPARVTWEGAGVLWGKDIFFDKCLSNITYLCTWWIGCICIYGFSQLLKYVCLDLWGGQKYSIAPVVFSGSFKVHLCFLCKLWNVELLQPWLTSFCGTLPGQDNGGLWRRCSSRWLCTWCSWPKELPTLSSSGSKLRIMGTAWTFQIVFHLVTFMKGKVIFKFWIKVQTYSELCNEEPGVCHQNK